MTKKRQLYNEFLKRHLEHTGKTLKEFKQRQGEIAQPVKAHAENFGRVVFRVDLRFSKTKILKELEREVGKWRKWYEEDFDEAIFDSEIDDTQLEWSENKKIELEQITEQMRKQRLDAHYKKRTRDPEDLELYKQYLQVWDFKERRKKSMKDIVAELPYITDKFMARDYYKAAKKCVEQGPPLALPLSEK